VPPGACTVHVEAWQDGPSVSGQAPARVEHGDVLVPPIDLTHPELRLHTAAGPHVVLVDGPGDEVVFVGLDDKGRGSLFGLAPGHYTAHVNAPDHPAMAEFDVKPGDSVVTVEVP